MSHHIRVMEFVEYWHDDVELNLLALYDERDHTDEEVCEMLRTTEYSDLPSSIIVLTPNQYNTVFRSLINKEEE